MTQERFKNEIEIRRFLLGEMTAEERIAFETKFIAEDTELFDEIGVTEDELIESYIRGTLDAGEKEKFEQHALTTKARRRRVALTRQMFDKFAAAKKTEAVAKDRSVRNSLINLFKTPRFAFGAAFAILLLVFGFWFLVFRTSENRNEIVRQTTPPPTVSNAPPKVEENQNLSVDSNSNSVNKPETNKSPTNSNAENPNKNQPKEIAPKPVVATIALFPGTVRGEGKMRVLDLTKDTRGANFVLNLESRDYQTYRAEIVDAEGSVLYRSGKKGARRSKVNIFFPTDKLKKGDYFVKLSGFNAAGEEESAADFEFRVNQK